MLTLSIADNLVLDQLDSPQYKSWSGRKLKAIQENGKKRIAEYDIRAQGEDEPLSALSGGNQQKVVMARELSRELKVLICAQPTRGLDVGSIEFMHRQIVAIRDEGVAVVIVSSELDEVIDQATHLLSGLSLYDGMIQDVVAPTTSREDFGLLMAGSRPAVTGATL